MAFLAMFHWGWLAGAALVGLAMGWISVVQRGEGLSRTALQRIALAATMVVAIALSRILPGRFGYWLDLGVVMLVSYLVGCAIGAWLRSRVVSGRASSG